MARMERMERKVWRQLVVGFARSGVLGFGGGPSSIPLVRYECARKYRWVSDEEFAEILALANALPGPIATKMAACVGYRVRGVAGACVAVLAHILPSILLLFGLMGTLYAFRGQPRVEGALRGVAPVIVVLLGVMTYEFVHKTWKGFGAGWSLFLLVAGWLLLQMLSLHPAILILGAILLAWFWPQAMVERVGRALRGGRGRE